MLFVAEFFKLKCNRIPSLSIFTGQIIVYMVVFPLRTTTPLVSTLSIFALACPTENLIHQGFQASLPFRPTSWVHFDRRIGPPACAAGGYPVQRQGGVGVYVCVLQDALNVAVKAQLGIDGQFGPVTHEAVKIFQGLNRLAEDGVVGCNTWQALMAQSVGRG